MSEPVSVLLLAAGVGSRLRPLTDFLPKCLVPIQGRPLLGLWLEMCEKAGIDDITVNTHHHAPLVEEFIRRSPYADRVKIAHEEKLQGTAGTLLANYKNLRHGTIMLVHADNLSRFDVAAFRRAHAERPAGALVTMMTFDTDAPSQSGIVELDANGLVTAFYEKQPNPPSNRANAAVYLMDRSFVDALAKQDAAITDFSTQVLPRLMGKIYTWHNASYHRDIGTAASLRLAQSEAPKAGIEAAVDGRYWYGLLDDKPRLAAALSDSVR